MPANNVVIAMFSCEADGLRLIFSCCLLLGAREGKNWVCGRTVFVQGGCFWNLILRGNSILLFCFRYMDIGLQNNSYLWS